MADPTTPALREVEQTREELGRTVDAIAQRLDPVQQAKNHRTAIAATGAAGAAVAAGVATLMVIRRRRR